MSKTKSLAFLSVSCTNCLLFACSIAINFILFVGPSAAQEADYRATGLWNGFLNQTNVLECLNGSTKTLNVELRVKDNSGALLGTSTLTIPAHGTKHFILNELGITDQYGTVLASASAADALRCHTAFYRFGPREDSSLGLEYAFSIPAGDSISGETSGVYNSMNPEAKPEPTYNWLSIYNPGETDFSAVIELYDQDGNLNQDLEVNALRPGERRDFALGHEQGQVVGIYRILPLDSHAPYGAFLARYQRTAENRFAFGFVLFPQAPSTDTGSIPISTMDPATNWVEIANPNAENALIQLELRDQNEALLYNEKLLIPGYSQRHVYVNQYLGERNTGSLRAISLNGARVLVQSMFYGHPSLGDPRVKWAYGSQKLRVQSGDETALCAVNTFLGAANWYREFAGEQALTAPLRLYAQDGSELSAPERGSLSDLALHESVGSDFVGLLTAEAQQGYSSELLRVYPAPDGGIETIMKVASSEIPSAENPPPPDGFKMPIGIPSPEFGLEEQAPAYDAQNTRHYYVKGPDNCSDSNNSGRGSPEAPRCSLPKDLAPGSYVEVHGGPYESNPHMPSWAGTPNAPVFIKGFGAPRFTQPFHLYNDAGGGGAYVVIEGLSFFSLGIGNSYHHVAIRGCDLYGDTDGGGMSIHANAKQVGPVHNIVIYQNEIHDNGIWDPRLAEGDRDIHGLSMGWYSKVEYVWILDNRIYHNEGDAIQVEAGPNASPSDVHHIYIGRNTMHHNKQSGVGLKNTTDVIISENDIFGHRQSSSAMGPGIGFSDNGPAKAWFIFNRIHDNEIGIKMNGGTTAGPHYIIGNLIYNIHAFTDGTFSPNDPWHYGQAVVDWHHAQKYFVNNTVYDTDGGYGFGTANYSLPENLVIANNIFSGLTTGAHAINVGDSETASGVEVFNNLFDYSFSIRWGSGRIYTSLESFQAASGKGASCLSGDPMFSDAPSADFHLESGSAAVDTGQDAIIEELAAVFFASYGLDIKQDIDAVARPQGRMSDVGAHEYQQ